MIFSLNQILHKLKCHAKIYVFIVLQIAIAIFILNASLLLSVNSDKRLQELLESNKNEEYYINVKDVSHRSYYEDPYSEELMKGDYLDIPFSNKNLEELSKILSDVDWKVEVTLKLDLLLNDKMSMQSVTAIYSTGTDKILMSKETYEIISNTYKVINQNDFPFTIIDNNLVGLDGSIHPITIGHYENLEIYLPYDMYYQIYHPKHLTNTRLSVVLKDLREESKDILLKAQMLLSSGNSRFLYFLNNEFYETLADFHSVMEDNQVFRFISFILLTITTIGLTGVFVLIINERKKEIAIHLALGSSKIRICLECFAEIAILALLGCALGLSSNILFCMKKLHYINVPLSPSLFVIIIQLMIICIIVVISMLPIAKTVAKLTPMEILRVE